MFGMGPTEWIIILVVVLLLFGPKKLPEIGKAVGQGIRELKKATDKEEVKEDKKAESATNEEKQA
jgi:sec-independent protein translocase protein TatA